LRTSRRSGLGERSGGEGVLDAAGDMAAQHLAGAGCVPVHGALQKERVLTGRDVAAKAQGEHLVAQVLVENRRMGVDQHF
jgi:hypothetical protein